MLRAGTALWVKNYRDRTITTIDRIYCLHDDDSVIEELGLHSVATRDHRNNTCFIHNLTNALHCALGVDETFSFLLWCELFLTVAKTAISVMRDDSTFCRAPQDSQFKASVEGELSSVYKKVMEDLLGSVDRHSLQLRS